MTVLTTTRLLSLFTLLLLGLAFTACKKDDDAKPHPRPQYNQATLSIRHDCVSYDPETGSPCIYYVLVLDNGQEYSVANPALIDSLKPLDGQRLGYTAEPNLLPPHHDPHVIWCGTPPGGLDCGDGILPGGCVCQPDTLPRIQLKRIWALNAGCQALLPSSAKPNMLAESAWIDGNCLALRVQYGGCGQRTDQFRLHWNGCIHESLPTQVDFYLEDQQLRDVHCMMLVTDTLYFDLSPLMGSTPTVIHVGGQDVTFAP